MLIDSQVKNLTQLLVISYYLIMILSERTHNVPVHVHVYGASIILSIIVSLL